MNAAFKTSMLAVAVSSAMALAAPMASAQTTFGGQQQGATGAQTGTAGMGMGGPRAGMQEITIGGQGGSDNSFDENTFSLSGSWGQYLDDNALWGIRQTLNVTDSAENNTIFDGATRVFYDYHFGAGATRPFIGASFGGFYGRNIRNTFAAGPEIGVKHWLQENVFIQAMAEYQFLFRSGRDARDRYDDGALFYSVGLGYNF